MRGFLITGAMCFIMLCLISANYIYVNNTSENMLSIASGIEALPSPSNRELIEDLKNQFQKTRMLLSISICTKDLENLSNCIDSVESANELNDKSRLAVELELLKNAIEALSRLERFGIDNIL